LGKGLSYFGPAERELMRCKPSITEKAVSAASGARPAACAQEKQVLGLCKP
jgi:hypothetical protein